jgi:hypothetical protein
LKEEEEGEEEAFAKRRKRMDYADEVEHIP